MAATAQPLDATHLGVGQRQDYCARKNLVLGPFRNSAENLNRSSNGSFVIGM